MSQYLVGLGLTQTGIDVKSNSMYLSQYINCEYQSFLPSENV